MATKQEMLLAVQAMRSNVLDRQQVDAALELQRRFDEQGKPIELGKILVGKGMLTRADFKALRRALEADEGPTPILDDIPGFRITDRLGSGGMANVYHATRVEDGLQVALKVLYPTAARNPHYVDQFLSEARLLVELDNPHIVQAHAYGFTGSRYYMALEYIDGPTVLGLLEERGRLPASFACYVISRVAQALDVLDRRGLVHRDIKPDNILVTSKGQVKIIDFGFVTRSGREPVGGFMPEHDGEERSDTTCGTVEYISPEQARGESSVDIRADIYSLGATLYHMVVGEVPFSGVDASEVMAKQVQEGLSHAVQSHDVPRAVHYFIEKMMAKEPGLRFQTPAMLMTELEGILSSMAHIDPGSIVPPSAGTASFRLEIVDAEIDRQDAENSDSIPTLKPTRPRSEGRRRRSRVSDRRRRRG